MSSGVCDQVRLKPACPATETSYSLEHLRITSIDIILSKRRTTKTQISLRSLICVAFVRIWRKADLLVLISKGNECVFIEKTCFRIEPSRVILLPSDFF